MLFSSAHLRSDCIQNTGTITRLESRDSSHRSRLPRKYGSACTGPGIPSPHQSLPTTAALTVYGLTKNSPHRINSRPSTISAFMDVAHLLRPLVVASLVTASVNQPDIWKQCETFDPPTGRVTSPICRSTVWKVNNAANAPLDLQCKLSAPPWSHKGVALNGFIADDTQRP